MILKALMMRSVSSLSALREKIGSSRGLPPGRDQVLRQRESVLIVIMILSVTLMVTELPVSSRSEGIYPRT